MADQQTWNCQGSTKTIYKVTTNPSHCWATCWEWPFLSNRSIQSALASAYDIYVSRELVRLAIKKLDFTYKKARFYGVSKNAEELNATFFKMRNDFLAQKRAIYSLDETGFGRFTFGKQHGYAKRGQRLLVQKLKVRMTSTSIIACCSSKGWSKTTMKKGAVNRQDICEFSQSMDTPRGSVILMDNASIQRGRR